MLFVPLWDCASMSSAFRVCKSTQLHSLPPALQTHYRSISACCFPLSACLTVKEAALGGTCERMRLGQSCFPSRPMTFTADTGASFPYLQDDPRVYMDTRNSSHLLFVSAPTTLGYVLSFTAEVFRNNPSLSAIVARTLTNIRMGEAFKVPKKERDELRSVYKPSNEALFVMERHITACI